MNIVSIFRLPRGGIGINLASASPAHDRRGEAPRHFLHCSSHLIRIIKMSSLTVENTTRSRGRLKQESGAHCVGHESGVGIIDDRGEGPVVVQEDHDLLSVGGTHDLFELDQSRGVPHLRRDQTPSAPEHPNFRVKETKQHLQSMPNAHRQGLRPERWTPWHE